MAAQTNAAEALAADFAAAIARGEPCYAAGAAAGRFELSSFLEIAQTDDGGMCSATIPAEGGVYAGGAARRDVSLPLAAIVAAAAAREATHGDLYAMQVPLDGSGPLRRAMARAAAKAVPSWAARRGGRDCTARPGDGLRLDRRSGADHHDGALRRPRELHDRDARPQDGRPLAARLPEARPVGAGLGISRGRGAAAAGGHV